MTRDGLEYDYVHLHSDVYGTVPRSEDIAFMDDKELSEEIEKLDELKYLADGKELN